MLRWLISILLLVAVWPQVGAADDSGGGGGCGGVWILPLNGSTTNPGGLVSVQNCTSNLAQAVVDLDDGTELGWFVVPAGSTGSFELPNDPALDGHDVTTTATSGTLTVTSTNPISSK